MKCLVCTALGTQCVLFQDTHSLDQFSFKAINIWKLCTSLAIEIKPSSPYLISWETFPLLSSAVPWNLAFYLTDSFLGDGEPVRQG